MNSVRKLTPTQMVTGVGVLILLLMALFSVGQSRALLTHTKDTPPRIDFTWSPEGKVSLMEMRAKLTIVDDHAIDFTTYRMHLIEIDRTIDLPIEGLSGRDYEQPISFSLIADNPKLVGKDKLTVEISVADDKGQVATLTKVIELKK